MEKRGAALPQVLELTQKEDENMNSELEKILFLKGKSHLPNILIASSECSPLSKTGGLADVAGALPKALNALGFDARVITPYHRCMKGKYDDKIQHMGEIYVQIGWRTEYAGLEKLTLDGITYYLVDSEFYYGDVIYRGGDGEVEQYAFFQRAVLELLPMLDFSPEVLHCNDWQTAMLPLMLKAQYQNKPQGKLKTVFSIHNLAFQGWLSPERAQELLGLDSAWLSGDGIAHLGSCNFMKGAVRYADRINTVSPSYADEIRTAEFGEGMDWELRRRGADVSGILNGIDTNEFNPATDPRVPYHFDLDHPEDKAKDKAALMEALGLTVSPETPIVAMVTRMTSQKGFGLVLQALDELMAHNVAFILLGTGDHAYEDAMRDYENRYRGRLCAYIGYNEDVARQIYAGADFLLMPSAFEPCGLSQMIAQRYGTLPIVHEVGGLRDTVRPYNQVTGEGDGFSFYDYSAGTMLGVISYALNVYYDKEAMGRLIHTAMSLDSSMGKCAMAYARLYLEITDADTGHVLHLPGDELYRKPIGAVRSGDSVLLRLRAGDFASNVRLIANGEEYPMAHIGDGLFSVEFTAPSRPGLVHYSFRLSENIWYGADGLGDHRMQPWQLTVYEAGFDTPDWAEGTVIYQLFPDRFARGGDSFAKGVEYHRSLGRNIEVHESWDEPVKFWPTTGEYYSPDDFYGGTLRGIIDALPDLAKRGVGCLCLNPIFESPSNHRYDVADYGKIDPMLGTKEDFDELCAKAAENGIHILLDGVFAHTGADSVYFNRAGRYPGKGAYQGAESPYYSWYEFRNFPDDYKCWWNLPSLPDVAETDPGWQEAVISGNDAVIKTWLRSGSGGWRLDVADELPDDVINKIRGSIKEEKPDALLIGDVWEDATNKVSYGAARRYALGGGLDSVMNYPLRSALIDFALERSSASQLRDFLLQQKLHYPAPMYRCLMNHLGTHDTPRIRTVLGSGLDGEGMSREERANFHLNWKQNQRGIALQRLCAAVQFSLPGMPSVYYGDEEGMQGFSDPFCRAPLERQIPENSLRDFYAGLALRCKNSDALRRGDAAFAAYGENVLVILRWVNGKATLTGINRGGELAGVVPSFGDFYGLSGDAASTLGLLPALEIPPVDFVIQDV